ncbi:MAG TPA: ABC transporter permease, partial [Actinomycetota bacterium]|nr:ABC transporter permease [Actinomycetota bacterium]HNO16005.1 ABC transporter permease [Actinomycetota bacterium]
AIGLVLGAWQIVVWSGWRPEYVLPGPIPTLQAVWEMMGTDRFWSAIATTLTRAVAGFALALLIGTTIGVLVARVRPLRLAVGALITGLQTMPSISWFPLAILLFGINEQAILFVVVLGAAPSIANGVISGIDQVPPAFWRLGRVLGAGPFAMYRNIILPAALPGYVSGLTQGWAFAWRSLMAGELLVIIAERPSLGAQLEFARQLAKAPQLLGTMLVILVIGMLVDGLFSSASRRMRERRGLAT